jgi:hypothetical protein
VKIENMAGQVYTERIMGPAVVDGISWVHETPFLNVDYEERRPFGAPTLKHLATKKTLRDQRNLNLSHFVNIPWAIAKPLWEYLTKG